MTDRYLAVLSSTRTGYAGGFPDLPGCVAAGKTAEQTRALLGEALALHLAALRDAGEQIPAASTTSVPDLAEGESAEWVTAALVNPVSQAVHGLYQEVGLPYRALAERTGLNVSALHRLQDPFYWGHSVSSLRKIADALGYHLDVQFRRGRERPPQPQDEPGRTTPRRGLFNRQK